MRDEEASPEEDTDAGATWGPKDPPPGDSGSGLPPVDPSLPYRDLLLSTEADRPLFFGITGHRPSKISTEQSDWAMNKVEYTLCYLRDWSRTQNTSGVVLLTGMAQGIDQWTAALAFRLNIPVFAVVPFKGQDENWYAQHRATYAAMLNSCWRVLFLQEEVPWNKKKITQALFQRNTWMAEYIARRKGVAMGIWNGEPGGTAHGVMQFRQRNVPMFLCNPVTRVMHADPTWPGMAKKDDPDAD